MQKRCSSFALSHQFIPDNTAQVAPAQCSHCGLMQKRHSSNADALELRLFCIKPLIYSRYCTSLSSSVLALRLNARDVTPLLTHWSYVSFALSHRFIADTFQLSALIDRCVLWRHEWTPDSMAAMWSLGWHPARDQGPVCTIQHSI